MAKSLSEMMKALPKERRERIEAETAREGAKIMSLRDVRKAFHKSQEDLAKALHMEQESISRIERRADLLLSTMRKYVSAMGGDLKLIAEFPDRPAIQIDTLEMLREPRLRQRRG
ncbi:MAG TPA: helix-turn-helix transcriptional regulator [Rhizomicrobium sp.]|nr:helix-turn-helix transcriptional regulator [Rhizomicrobium sp.]